MCVRARACVCGVCVREVCGACVVCARVQYACVCGVRVSACVRVWCAYVWCVCVHVCVCGVCVVFSSQYHVRPTVRF